MQSGGITSYLFSTWRGEAYISYRTLYVGRFLSKPWEYSIKDKFPDKPFYNTVN